MGNFFTGGEKKCVSGKNNTEFGAYFWTAVKINKLQMLSKVFLKS